MAYAFNQLHVRCDQQAAFTFVSDLRHAPLWDPNTTWVEKLTPGAIGPGTRFSLSARLKGLPLRLPYEVVRHEAPRCLVIEGSTWCMRYREHVSFRPDAGGTRIRYHAWLWLRSLLSPANPLLSLAYPRVADIATSGMVAAIEAHGKAAAARLAPPAEMPQSTIDTR